MLNHDIIIVSLYKTFEQVAKSPNTTLTKFYVFQARQAFFRHFYSAAK